MRSTLLIAVAMLAGTAFAVGACGSGGGKGAPCVEDMPGMIMCSYGVPVPATPATHAPTASPATPR